MNLKFWKRDKKLTAYTDMNIGNYDVLMYRKIGDRYVKIDKKRISVKDTKFTYKGKDFVLLDLSKILFSDNKHNYYGFDFDNGTQLCFTSGTIPKNISLEEIDNYVNKGIIQQLTNNLEEKHSDTGKMLIWIIIGIAIGGLAGYVIGTSMGNTPHIEMLLMGVI